MDVFIERKSMNNVIEVWVSENQGSERVNFSYNDGFVKCTTFDRTNPEINEELKPFMVLPAHIFYDIAKELAAHLKRQGMNLESEHLVKGKLEATESHLNDMREISFKLLSSVTHDFNTKEFFAEAKIDHRD